MVRKRIIIDKADRLYQMPQRVAEFYPHSSLLTGKKIATLDIARPQWAGAEAESSPQITGTALTEADGFSFVGQDDESVGRLKELISEWARRELSLTLDPRKQIFVDGSIRRLLALVGLGFLDPGDVALYPNPGYPIYRQAILTYGAEPVGYHLTEKRDFKPRLKQFTERIGKAARLMFLNNPHNPSGSELDSEELDELLWLAARDNILIVSDAAYYAYRHEEGVSLLGSASGKRVGLELYSFSYLTGVENLPLGFALGSKELIAGLESAANIYGQILTREWIGAAEKALTEYPSGATLATRARIRETRPAAEKLCEALHLTPVSPERFPYALAQLPQRKSSQAFAATLLRRYGLVTLPGVAFGDLGEGYVRLTTTTGPMIYDEALRRVSGERKTG